MVRDGDAWMADRFGAPGEVLRRVARTWGDPAPGEVLVRVLACGVGLPDALMLRGGYATVRRPPVTPGQEVSGIVVAAGAGSSHRPGERVMGYTSFTTGSGGYADYALLPAATCLPAPAALSDAEAAAFMIAYRTAYAALVERAAVAAEETLLVLGASGSSGAAAIDLGRALGARVIAVAGGAAKVDHCRTLGADDAIDHRGEDVAGRVHALTGGRGADVIFDPVGGDLAARALGAIARHGRIAVVGYASGAWVTLDPLDMVLRSWSAVGVYAGAFSAAADAHAFAELTALAEAGRIKPPVSRIYAFDEVPAVLAALEGGAPPGKLTVAVSTTDPRSRAHGAGGTA